MEDVAEALRARLQADLRAAMKARDKDVVDVLRTLIAAIDNAGAIELPASTPMVARSEHVATGGGPTEAARKALSDADLAALLHRETEERRAAADELIRHGKDQEAAKLRAAADVVDRYL